LPQQLIDQRGLAVVDVRNDGDITKLIHELTIGPGGVCHGR
jgi:hypothetical protein